MSVTCLFQRSTTTTEGLLVCIVITAHQSAQAPVSFDGQMGMFALSPLRPFSRRPCPRQNRLMKIHGDTVETRSRGVPSMHEDKPTMT